jgi:DNA-binding MarR family transcriptional regulator
VSAATEPDVPGPGFAEACAALGDDLGWALGAFFRSYRDAVKDTLGALPGGPRGYQVLRFAAGEAPATQLALAQQLGIDRTVMTYLLDDLEAEGLVERRPDPADRRARRVVATPAGRSRLVELDRGLRRAEASVLGPLAADEVAVFRRLLQRLATQGGDLSVDEACRAANEVDDEEAAATSPARRRRRGPDPR